MHELTGVLGGVLVLASNLYYIVLIRRGQATPHPVTWALWALLGGLGALSAVLAGAGPAAVVPVAYAAIYLITCYVAVDRHRRRPSDSTATVSRADVALGALAAVLGLAWWRADLGPGWLAALAVSADAAALVPTLRFAWTEPSTRPERWAWSADAVSTALGVASAATPWHPAAIAYPLYLLAGNCLVTALLWYRAGQAGPAPGRSSDRPVTAA